MLEAILPISNREPERLNLERMELLLDSLSFFWIGEERLRIHIVCPDDEFALVDNALDQFGLRSNLDVRTLTEAQVSPLLSVIPRSAGTAKQMIIKLAAYEFVKSPFYLTLDTDVVACKPFSSRDLILGNKALTEWQLPTLFEWWQQSATILGCPSRIASLGEQPRIYVTPQVLSADIARALCSFLTETLKENWIEGLVSRYTGNHPHIWTEYTLYALFADEMSLLSQYHWLPHEIPSTWRLHVPDQSIWYANQFDNWSPERALEPTSAGYFIVMQSITAHELDFGAVRERWSMAIRARYPDLIPPTVYETLALLKPYDISVAKRRIGPKHDGGYVYADRLRPEQIMLSYGIGQNIGFELELASSGHRVIMFDHTIPGLVQNHDNFSYYQEGLAEVSDPSRSVYSLADHIHRLGLRGADMLLKLDIEGTEWDVLCTIPDDVLLQFEQISFEAHWLLRLENREFKAKVAAALRSINKNFVLFHVHANNYGGLGLVDGFPMADVLELSYIRRDLINISASTQIYPTGVDFPNHMDKADIVLCFFPFLPCGLPEARMADTAAQVVRSRDRR